MDSHPVPREISSFEFKLIGFMTLHQFYYVLMFGGIGLVFYFIKLPFFINYLLTGVFVLIGIGLAFGKYNDRPIDNLIKNLIIHLMRPTQFSFHKNNLPPDYLLDVLVTTKGPMLSHSQTANKYLQNYQNKTSAETKTTTPNIQTESVTIPAQPSKAVSVEVEGVVSSSVDTEIPQTPPSPNIATASTPTLDQTKDQTNPPAVAKSAKPTPFITGVAKTTTQLPLPNILVYFKSPHGSIVRLVKTNQNGVFASFHPLPIGEYVIEAKDLSAKHFFDTINFTVGDTSSRPIEIISRS